MNTMKQFAAACALTSVFAAAGPVLANDWEGGYVGLHAGYAKGNRDSKYDVSIPGGGGLLFSDKKSYDQKGALGGVHLGYNFLVNPKVVLGLKADWSWSDIDGSSNFPTAGGPPFRGKGNYEWLASTTARVGYLVTDKFLLFGDGGLAFGRYKFSADSGYNFDETRSGWTLGVGGEYRFAPRASVTLQYNRYDFGSEKNHGSAFGGFLPVSSKADADLNVFKLGFNYRF